MTKSKIANSKKAWSGRFAMTMDETMEDFNSSLHFDKRLYKHDIEGSIAYAKGLLEAGIIKQSEHSLIVSGLKKIQAEIEAGKFEFKKEHEDVHMNIEAALTANIGEAGKKLHTGRSRNDQVVTDVRLYLKEETEKILLLIKNLQKTFVHLATVNIEVIMPGYTHMQKAMPVLFSHHMMAYFEMLKRDKERLQSCFERIDVLPLGSAALAGSSYPLNRKMIARALGFSDISKNSLDAVSDRDFVAEFISCISIMMMHLSRLSEEVVLWTTSEFGYIELSDKYSTGSSIMPQKKNPDIAELTRGKSGRVFGDLMTVLTVMKGLPLSYNRDMQEDKEPLFDAVDTAKACLEIVAKMISTMKINKDVMRNAVDKGWLTATDLADYLAKNGVPFREAHEIVGKIVKYCIDNNKEIYSLSKKEFQLFSDKIHQDVYDYIAPEYSINIKNIEGGTAKKQVIKAIAEAKLGLKK